MLATLFACVDGLYAGAIIVPEDYSPWAPLNLTAPLNVLTGYKLRRTRTDPAACRAALVQTGMQCDTLPGRVTGRAVASPTPCCCAKPRVGWGWPPP